MWLNNKKVEFEGREKRSRIELEMRAVTIGENDIIFLFVHPKQIRPRQAIQPVDPQKEGLSDLRPHGSM